MKRLKSKDRLTKRKANAITNGDRLRFFTTFDMELLNRISVAKHRLG